MTRYLFQLTPEDDSIHLQLAELNNSAITIPVHAFAYGNLHALREVPLVVDRFEQIDLKARENGTVPPIRHLVSNYFLLYEARLGNENNPFAMFIQPSVGVHNDANAEYTFRRTWTFLATLKAIDLYLTQDERYLQWDISIACVYCAWQRFQLMQSLWFIPVSDHEEKTLRDYEMALAYQALANRLEDKNFSYAFHVLWRYGKMAPELSQDEIRERLRLSMVLTKKSNDDAANEISSRIEAQPLVPALGKQKMPAWKDATIHRRYCEGNGSVAVHQIIRNWLLPRSAIFEAIQLALKLRFPNCHLPKKLWRGFLTILLILQIVALAAAWLKPWPWTNDISRFLLHGGLLGLLLIVALFLLDIRSIMHLALPRVIGGILVGYLPLILTDEAWKLTKTFQVHTAVIALWLIVALLFAFFLFIHVKGFVERAGLAMARAATTLFWGVLVSLFFGIWLIQIAQPIYSEVFATANIDVQPCLPGVVSNTCVPLSVLVIFAPLALSVGLVTQLLWQGKLATEPIWLEDSVE